MQLPHFIKCSEIQIILHSAALFQGEDSVLNRSTNTLKMKKQEDGTSAEQDIALGS